jgi:hypothetical protein
MIPVTILTRRARAEAAIGAYCRSAIEVPYDEALIDLLTDLMHWTDGNGLDFQNAIDHADFHHAAEVKP